MISTATALIHIIDHLLRTQDPNTHTHTCIHSHRLTKPTFLPTRHFDPIWLRLACFRTQTRLHGSEFLRLLTTLVISRDVRGIGIRIIVKWPQGRFSLKFGRDIFCWMTVIHSYTYQLCHKPVFSLL